MQDALEGDIRAEAERQELVRTRDRVARCRCERCPRFGVSPTTGYLWVSRSEGHRRVAGPPTDTTHVARAARRTRWRRTVCAVRPAHPRCGGRKIATCSAGRRPGRAAAIDVQQYPAPPWADRCRPERAQHAWQRLGTRRRTMLRGRLDFKTSAEPPAPAVTRCRSSSTYSPLATSVWRRAPTNAARRTDAADRRLPQEPACTDCDADRQRRTVGKRRAAPVHAADDLDDAAGRPRRARRAVPSAYAWHNDPATLTDAQRSS